MPHSEHVAFRRGLVASLYKYIDDLELYETWLVSGECSREEVRKLVRAIEIDGRKFSVLSPPTGLLVVRLV